VESVPGKRCSAWVFRDTRTPVSVVFDNLEVGASIGEIMEWFHLSYEQVVAVSRVGRHHLPDHKPVEQHSDTGQMLLDRGNSALVLQQLDICGHMHRLNAPEFAKPLPFAPAHKLPGSPAYAARVFLLRMLNGEEFEEAPGGPFPCPGDERRQV
jgi:uncharacterized protein (DUF433 family)